MAGAPEACEPEAPSHAQAPAGAWAPGAEVEAEQDASRKRLLGVSLNSEHLDCVDFKEELKGKVDKEMKVWPEEICCRAWEILAERAGKT